MKEKLTRKAINFDLDTKELLKHFKNTHQAYSAIKVFMEDKQTVFRICFNRLYI